MSLTRYKIVGVTGATHLNYKGKNYELDPDVLTDAEAELLEGKTPHLVRLPEPAPVAEQPAPTEPAQLTAGEEAPAPVRLAGRAGAARKAPSAAE